MPKELIIFPLCGQVGYIQIGTEQLLIQPVNISETSFSGREHFIRHKRSPKSSYPAKSQVPDQPCKVLSEKKRQKKVKPANDWRERRNAIRLTNEYTVETLVVADADMVQYHGAEAAQRFILTVMNMVYNMFQHQSLGIKVSIRVTKLVLLRNRPAKLSIGHHGERSLESFCHWQNEEYGGAKYLGNNQVPGARDDTPPVDAAVFVTSSNPFLFVQHKGCCVVWKASGPAVLICVARKLGILLLALEACVCVPGSSPDCSDGPAMEDMEATACPAEIPEPEKAEAGFSAAAAA
ncbi:A disintegrin and metalloproteinase with thrombospondin motifs 17 [Chelonia mydas]|uniref:A disintegrin and metalloproteinase with thrombospondin motifs 17 n=1 Tax=Chelonia mydas TaxID=8469 RepID=M7CKR0_CHEMY|nr:A disintegrin and metalloproteinase with thrombospondin motifs 17 [Chelonia mydas]